MGKFRLIGPRASVVTTELHPEAKAALDKGKQMGVSVLISLSAQKQVESWTWPEPHNMDMLACDRECQHSKEAGMRNIQQIQAMLQQSHRLGLQTDVRSDQTCCLHS